ncbi:uncharacterized protein HMPREF1541_03144 [Cyphellophora europaea CBS 101466]|uniref:BTB domain-containing protein n=1 Tax=Cyphellophora europaea (strain CBS 101466) TaxID=1220924 RepID=W2RZT6_CYPE1|nr:uncharacterized protein HMPREF1541_03144 [Cyphellophora europaea CBS 101466]ETN41209.1 hypothetical protein HMPREF1541_03144 [Cyphellophora europaea CBS 101466]
MVSHPEVAPAPSRRAPSVSSRTSRSRHHHRGHSHHGGSNHTSQNEFPFFALTGDVEIVIACDAQEKRYLLHRLILGQFSGFFEAGMSEEWSRSHALAPLSQPPPQGALTVIGEEAPETVRQPPLVRPDQMQAPGRKRWRYELDWANLEEDEEPMLIQKPPSGGLFTASFQPSAAPRARPPTNQSFFRSVANLTLGHHGVPQSSAEPVDPALHIPLIRDYDNLFRIFYNFAPVLNSTNIAAAYSECKSLLSLADMYDALPVVGPRIDHHLLRFGSRLFKQIAKYPPSYLKLGYLSRSRIIFSEALTHVVGQWPSAYPYLKPPDQTGGGYEVPQSVIDLIEDKVDELEELKQKVEAKLFRLTITTSRGERVNPSNDYLGWLAMSLFRQWVAENTTPEVRGILKNSPGSRPGSGNANPGQPPPPPTLSPSRIYRLIASTNSQSYLANDELRRFLKCQPHSSRNESLYSKDNLRRFERRMEEIKNIARDMVKPLTRNCLELDLRLLSDGGGGGLGYLTCMRCEEDEIPWD